MQKKGRKGVLGREPHFPESLKIAIAREYLTGQLSYGQLAEKHQLPSSDTARYFVTWYKKWQSQQDSTAAAVPTEQGGALSETIDQLKHANLRITALEMLIKNAEKELGVDITKKFGTKQPGK